MGSFLQQHLDYVFAIYGLAFILLAAMCAVIPKASARGTPWIWLILFGLVHGATEWMEIFAMDLHDTPVFRGVRLAAMALSFVFLCEFGRKALGKLKRKGPGTWIYVPLFALAGLGALGGTAGLQATMRYALALTGGLCAAWALYQMDQQDERSGGSLALAAIGLAGYAVAAGAVVPRAPFFPATVLNADWFLSAAGMPIQMVRTALGLLIAIGLWTYSGRLRRIDFPAIEGKGFTPLGFGLAIVLIMTMAAGSWFSKFTSDWSDRGVRNMLQVQAGTAAAGFTPGEIAHLSRFTIESERSNYQHLKDQLEMVNKANPGLHAAYVLILRDGKAIKAVSADIDGPDHTKRGVDDGRTPEELREAFSSGRLTTLGPYHRGSDEVLSALAPIRDPHTNILAGALGIDISADDWKQAIAEYRLTGIAVTLLLIVLTIYYFVVHERMWRLSRLSARSESRLSAAQRMAYIGNWSYDRGSGSITWSDEMFRIYGRDPGEGALTDPRQLRAFTHPQDWRQLRSALNRAIKTGADFQAAFRVVRPDGSLRHVEATAHVSRSEGGKVVALTGTIQDITERIEAERDLHQYTERLEALREIDAAILGAQSTKEVVQGPLARLRRIVPFERAAVVLFNPSLTEGTLLAVDQDYPWLPLAGEVRPISDFHDPKDLCSAPFLDLPDLRGTHGCPIEELMLSQGLRNLVYVPMVAEGKLLGFLAFSATAPGRLTSKHSEIALDMASKLVVAIQHTRLREELDKSNQLLESKVEERTAELQTTIATMRVLEGVLRQREAEARAASEAKSTFLASMSHELRTPLIGVTGMLEVLMQSDLDAEQREVVNIVQDSSGSLLHIIGDILDFSKIEANMLELTLETISLRALMDSVSQIFRPAAFAKGLNLSVDVDPGIAPAHLGDALRIRQILNNFLSNAVKFTETGSIALRLRLLGSGNGRESLAFEVQDTGIGVLQENLGKLFEAFTQAEASTTRRFGGTGLGLAISRRLAELMGGKLNVQSTPGEGTTITLEVELAVGNPLDLVQADEPGSLKAVSRRPAPTIEAAEQEHSLVLLAEDHPTNRTVLTQQINRAGYALEVAVDGQEAFEKWQSGRFALILTDLHMPGMDGYQLTKTVRDWEGTHGTARTPILALTANAMSGETERCLELGMDDYLVKPVTIPLLESKLRQWMPKARSGTALELPRANPKDPEPWLHGLDSKTLLDLCGGSAEAAREILADFIATTKADLLEMQEALGQKDLKCIVRQSHRIKGSSTMIGARDLGDRTAKLEAYAMTETADWELIQEQVAGIQEALKALEAASE